MTHLYQIRKHNSPIISLVLHDGHFISENIQDYLALDERERLREGSLYSPICRLADKPSSGLFIKVQPIITVI